MTEILLRELNVYTKYAISNSPTSDTSRLIFHTINSKKYITGCFQGLMMFMVILKRYTRVKLNQAVCEKTRLIHTTHDTTKIEYFLP